MRLRSEPERFFDAFSALARKLSGSAALLNRSFVEPERAADLAAEITELEAEATRLREAVVADIENVVVTPLDREDVHQVALRLGDLVSLIDKTARHAQMLNLGPTREPAQSLSEVLVRAAACIETSVTNLRRPDVLAGQRDELERLGEEGAAISDRATEVLFLGSPDPMEVIRWKDVYASLEHAISQCREVGSTLSSIALENRG